jgi:hypothetical protein
LKKKGESTPMINPATPALRNLVQWLLVREAVTDKPSEAILAVCRKLQHPLSILFGTAGYRSLFSRALTLAKNEVPGFDAVNGPANGLLAFPEGIEFQADLAERVRGGTVFLSQVLGLLVLFIGGSLMLQIVHDIWPEAPFDGRDSKTEGKA